MSEQRDYTEIARNYAQLIIERQISACAYVRQACQRYFDDVERSKDDQYPYYFNTESARKVCLFAERMVHIKGREWAGKKIILQPWQVFFLSMIFGWLQKDNNCRRFREVYAEIPRKNGKSVLGAVIALYMLCADGEPGAEVYAGATCQHQALEVFGAARQMCMKNAAFKKYYELNVGAENISIRLTASKFEPLVGNPGDGASPHCAIVDEYHEHATPNLYDTMLTGMGARSQPLLVVITTAGVDTSSPCYAKRDEAVKILGKIVENERLFSIIYTIDEEDDWSDLKMWEKANPNYGVSIYPDFLEARRKEAINVASRQNIIKCKHLNIWSNTGTAWINMQAWNACRIDMKMEEFQGEPCYVGIDLASKVDLTAMMFLFKRGDEYYLFSKYYLPEDTIDLPENAHYQRWRDEGFLTSTPGARTDYRYLQDDLYEFDREFKVTELVYDPHEAEMLIQEIREKVTFPCIEVNQSPAYISEPMKEFEALYLSGKLHHDGNPMTTWQASNVVLRSTRTKSYYPSKERKDNKIDGIVASIMALSRAKLAKNEESVYNTRGFLEF